MLHIYENLNDFFLLIDGFFYTYFFEYMMIWNIYFILSAGVNKRIRQKVIPYPQFAL